MEFPVEALPLAAAPHSRTLVGYEVGVSLEFSQDALSGSQGP